jgi:helix-turn-helix protein
MRHTTFRFALDPTPVQESALVRHAGASRFAYNQTLRLVSDALGAKRTDPTVTVPWSGFDLINVFNAWKKTEKAGRVFVVAPDGTIAKKITGLAWRHEVGAQVFEEAAIDLGRALAGYVHASPALTTVAAASASPSTSARAAAATASGSATGRARPAASASGSVSGIPAP